MKLSDPPPARLLPLVMIGLTTLGWLGAGWFAWRQTRHDASDSTAPAPLSRRTTPPALSVDSPFKNVRPGVRYVGDPACARCHAEIVERYHAHPMGRSLAPVAEWTRPDRTARPGTSSFEAQGFVYTVEERDGRVYHKEARLDAKGGVIVERAAEIQFAIGSGTRGTSFVLDQGGTLFESPLTWYAQAGRWDLSPGYEVENQHFQRMVQEDCLYCHANPVEPVPDTNNRFRDSIGQARSIGCERCHGPGERHVQKREVVDGIDLTIVNPRHLEPARREAVCQQCHLKGDIRIVHDGLESNDFRPGLPLRRVWSVFFRPEHLGARTQVVGHVEQMASSRCYRESEGRLGCTSCHDPHQSPPPEERAAFYRSRCLECHEEKGCSLEPAERRKLSRDDSCFQCHMPRSATQDVVHVASTNHRIVRREGEQPKPDDTIEAQGKPLVPFHLNAHESEREDQDGLRDLGVALSSVAWTLRNTRQGAEMSRQSLALLAPALRRRPNDVVARESKGLALSLQDRDAEALAEFEALLQAVPLRENALVFSAYLLSQAGRPAEAVARWRRALAVNPWVASRQLPLAQSLAREREWKAAADACRAALRLDPTLLEARKLLVDCYFKSGESERARAELQTLFALDPPGRDALLREFDLQPGATEGAPR